MQKYTNANGSEFPQNQATLTDIEMAESVRAQLKPWAIAGCKKSLFYAQLRRILNRECSAYIITTFAMRHGFEGVPGAWHKKE